MQGDVSRAEVEVKARCEAMLATRIKMACTESGDGALRHALHSSLHCGPYCRQTSYRFHPLLSLSQHPFRSLLLYSSIYTLHNIHKMALYQITCGTTFISIISWTNIRLSYRFKRLGRVSESNFGNQWQICIDKRFLTCFYKVIVHCYW